MAQEQVGDGGATPAEDAPDQGVSTPEPAEGADDKPGGGADTGADHVGG